MGSCMLPTFTVSSEAFSKITMRRLVESFSFEVRGIFAGFASMQPMCPVVF